MTSTFSGAELVRFPVYHRTIFATKAAGRRLDLSANISLKWEFGMGGGKGGRERGREGKGDVEYDCPYLIIRVKETFQRIIDC